jgi:hypothetical protein
VRNTRRQPDGASGRDEPSFGRRRNLDSASRSIDELTPRVIVIADLMAIRVFGAQGPKT